MNLRKIMNETLIANNGDMSRGLKNQLNKLPLIASDELETKIALLKKEGISIYNYYGLRVLEFNYEIIETVLNDNRNKIDSYTSDPQELVRDLRKKEIEEYGYNFETDILGGM